MYTNYRPVSYPFRSLIYFAHLLCAHQRNRYCSEPTLWLCGYFCVDFKLPIGFLNAFFIKVFLGALWHVDIIYFVLWILIEILLNFVILKKMNNMGVNWSKKLFLLNSISFNYYLHNFYQNTFVVTYLDNKNDFILEYLLRGNLAVYCIQSLWEGKFSYSLQAATPLAASREGESRSCTFHFSLKGLFLSFLQNSYNPFPDL